jgi:hypothetical protein
MVHGIASRIHDTGAAINDEAAFRPGQVFCASTGNAGQLASEEH